MLQEYIGLELEKAKGRRSLPLSKYPKERSAAADCNSPFAAAAGDEKKQEKKRRSEWEKCYFQQSAAGDAAAAADVPFASLEIAEEEVCFCVYNDRFLPCGHFPNAVRQLLCVCKFVNVVARRKEKVEFLKRRFWRM